MYQPCFKGSGPDAGELAGEQLSVNVRMLVLEAFSIVRAVALLRFRHALEDRYNYPIRT
jgi:hypothetical protein